LLRIISPAPVADAGIGLINVEGPMVLLSTTDVVKVHAVLIAVLTVAQLLLLQQPLLLLLKLKLKLKFKFKFKFKLKLKLLQQLQSQQQLLLLLQLLPAQLSLAVHVVMLW